MRSGVTAQRAAGADTHWGLWSAFCDELAVDALLSNLQDPVALLQVFAQRYRTLEPEATTVIVLSTAGFVVTAGLWLALLAVVG